MHRYASRPFIIAVDSGGTHTRVGCFGLDGELIATASGPGGSPFHNDRSAENVSGTVHACLRRGELDLADAAGLAAGMAEVQPGRRDDETNAWASSYFANLPGSCPRVIVNDAVAAHRGALLGRPGVIVVAGTGSMILAITADGHEVESGRFEHYAGAARHLAYEAVQLILIGADQLADTELVASIVAYWGAANADELRHIVLGLDRLDRKEVMPRYGGLAPMITAAADTSPLADRAVCHLAEKTARGVRLVSTLISEQPVPVALAGAVATQPAFRGRLAMALREGAERADHAIVAPVLGPLGGAALLAFEAAGIPWSDALRARLAASEVRISLAT